MIWWEDYLQNFKKKKKKKWEKKKKLVSKNDNESISNRHSLLTEEATNSYMLLQRTI